MSQGHAQSYAAADLTSIVSVVDLHINAVKVEYAWVTISVHMHGNYILNKP